MENLTMSRGLRHRQGQQVGEYTVYDTCRFCLKPGLNDFLDFGYVPLAGGFLRSRQEFTHEKVYPFAVSCCPHCGLVQSRYVVDKSTLFEDYFYHSSAIGTLADHFKQYAKELALMVGNPEDKLVVEIGSNDGVFLRPLRKLGFRVLGVDPAKNIVREVNQQETPTLCAYFDERTANKVRRKWGRANLIVTSNSFAHIDDMHDVLRGIVALLKPDGILCVENEYIGTLIKENQYDLMYHEHMSYYSLSALQSFLVTYGLEIFDVRPLPIHASTMRYYIQFISTGRHKKTKALFLLEQEEKRSGLILPSTFRNYSGKLKKLKQELLTCIRSFKKQGKRIYGYGASGRATMVMSYCGITAKEIDCMVDDAPFKQGAFMPGNHIPIVSSEVLYDRASRPDYCLLFAWSFADEIVARNKQYRQLGGRFIIPLPKVKVR